MAAYLLSAPIGEQGWYHGSNLPLVPFGTRGFFVTSLFAPEQLNQEHQTRHTVHQGALPAYMVLGRH
jgi:hypothetical protein